MRWLCRMCALLVMGLVSCASKPEPPGSAALAAEQKKETVVIGLRVQYDESRAITLPWIRAHAGQWVCTGPESLKKILFCMRADPQSSDGTRLVSFRYGETQWEPTGPPVWEQEPGVPPLPERGEPFEVADRGAARVELETPERSFLVTIYVAGISTPEDERAVKQDLEERPFHDESRLR